MVKKKRSLTSVFNDVMGTTEEEEKKEDAKQEVKQEEKTPEIEVVKEEKAPEIAQQETPQEVQETQQEELQQEDQEEGLISKFKKKKEKKKVEETHQRVTFLVRNELKVELDKLFKKYGYGFKTLFINEAIEKQLERVREEETKNKKK